MAVIGVKERWEGRGATTDEKGVRTLKRQWTVETDSPLTGEPDVVDAVIAYDASAALYASHPNWARSVCRSLAAVPYKGPTTWLVDAAYSSAPFEARGDGSGSGSNGSVPGPGMLNDTPANSRPPRLSIGKKETTEPLEFDLVTEQRILNSVGDPFDPVPEVFRSNHLITYRFYRSPAALQWPTRSLFQDSVNDGVWAVLGRNYPAYSLRCVEYSLETEWEVGALGMEFFYALTCQLEYNPKLWKIKLLNMGCRKQVGSMGDPDGPEGPLRNVAIVDTAGQPITAPVPLGADNLPVPPGGAYHYLEFDGYLPLDWTNLLA